MKYLNEQLIAESFGWRAMMCPHCHCQRAFLILDVRLVWPEYEKENFFSDRGGWVYRCSYCLNEEFRGQLERSDTHWQPIKGLDTLVGYQPEDPKRKPLAGHQSEQLRALLKGLEYHVKRTPLRDAGIGFVEGAKKGAIFGLAAGFAFAASWALKSDNFDPVTPILGSGALGAVLGSPLGYRRKLRVLRTRLFRRQLAEICALHEIAGADLLAACTGRSRRFRRLIQLSEK